MKIKISELVEEDVKLISENLQTDFDEFWNENILISEIKNENTKYIKATIEDKIVGFAGILINYDDIHIMNIVVRKDCRKNGIGNELLKSLIELAKKENKESLTLEVNEKNVPAIKLYEKFNFENLGIRKRYYNNTDNAIIMTLKF